MDDTLALATIHWGFRDLEASLAQSLAQSAALPDGAGRVLALAEAYVAFARARPEAYRIMHGGGGAAVDPAAVTRAAAGVCALTADALRDWAAGEGVALRNPLEAAEVLWAALHGICWFEVTGRLGEDRARARWSGAPSATYWRGGGRPAVLTQAGLTVRHTGPRSRWRSAPEPAGPGSPRTGCAAPTLTAG